jgi:mycofactocin precursor
MSQTHIDPAPQTADSTTFEAQDIVAEDLIEEVSIDGMCGVY